MRLKIPLLIACFIGFYFISHGTTWANHFSKEWDIFTLLNNLKKDFFNRSFLVFLLNSVLTYLWFHFFYPKKGIVFTLSVYLLIALPAMIALRFLLEEFVAFHITGRHNYNMKYLTFKSYVLDNLYFITYYNLVGIAFFAVQYEHYKKLKENELKLQVRNAELSFLKSQINPHFLFNNLNNIYTLVYQQSANALPAISKLSDLLRYMLYQKDDFVPLTKEIEYLHNFIDLQLLRYDFSPAREIHIQSAIDPNLEIIPLSLIPFVENAFKHGDLKDTAQPLAIQLRVSEETLFFSVGNKKGNYSTDASGGIGLENVKKRLELLTPEKYELQIIETDDYFKVELKMNTNG